MTSAASGSSLDQATPAPVPAPASSAKPAPLATPPAPRGAPIRKIAGSWPPIEAIPWLHAFVQTLPGKLALLLVFTGLMAVTRVRYWWAAAVMLALLSLFPQQRRRLLVIGAVAWMALIPPLVSDPNVPDALLRAMAAHGISGFFAGVSPTVTTMLWGLLAGLFAWTMGWSYISLVRRYPKSIIGQRPIACLMVLLVLVMSAQGPLGGTAWLIVGTIAMALSHYIWFFAYSLSEPKQKDGSSPPPKVGYWRYFWAVNRCPIGKGPSYLERIEARTDAELATVQLKGLKLLIWATALSVFRVFYNNLLYGPHGESLTKIPGWEPAGLIPTYAMALHAQLAGDPYPWAVRWLAIISQFFLSVLGMAIWGHKAIAVARMAGFNAFRMTYKPLLATTIAEFFNRLHWYFKEMLATFFFFPTYLRYFKKHPRLRVFAATMSAACFGNFFYHFFAYDRHVFDRGIASALWTYHAYAAYAAILGVAIAISQIRILTGKRKVAPTGLRKVRAIAGVLLFYCLLTVFDAENRHDVTFAGYASHFFSLFRP